MPELEFITAQDYLNYDFDDNFCFFFEELKEYGDKLKNIDDMLLIEADFEQEFAKIIKELFNTYETLIIDTEKEQLLGTIGNTKILIKQGPAELS